MNEWMEWLAGQRLQQLLHSFNLNVFHWLRMRRGGEVVWRGVGGIVSWTAEPHSGWMGIVIWISMANQNTFSRRGGWFMDSWWERQALHTAMEGTPAPADHRNSDVSTKKTLQMRITYNIFSLILIKWNSIASSDTWIWNHYIKHQ